MLRLRHLLSILGGHCESQELVSNSVSAQSICLRCCKNFRWRFSRVNMPKWDKCDDSEIQLSTPHVECDSCTKCQTSTRDGIIFDTKSRTHVYEMKNHCAGNHCRQTNVCGNSCPFTFSDSGGFQNYDPLQLQTRLCQRTRRKRNREEGGRGTRHAVIRGRTWLAWCSSGAHSAATLDQSFHLGGGWARTMSERTQLFCLCVSVCVSLCVSLCVSVSLPVFLYLCVHDHACEGRRVMGKLSQWY